LVLERANSEWRMASKAMPAGINYSLFATHHSLSYHFPEDSRIRQLFP
jgi:hypothetical protein